MISHLNLYSQTVFDLEFSLGDTDKILNAIDQWTRAAQTRDGSDAEELGRMVDELLQQESSFAEQNAKRFKAVNEAFQKPTFEVQVYLVDVLMQPIDKAVNTLLKRTSILKAIRFWQADKPSRLPDLKVSSRDFFLAWSRGQFGDGIVSDFFVQLRSSELAKHTDSCSDPSVMDTCFSLVVFGVTDSWWRCSFRSSTFPSKMFSLAMCDLPTFVRQWGEYRAICDLCPQCVDAGFSEKLLRSMDLTRLSPPEVHQFYEECLGDHSPGLKRENAWTQFGFYDNNLAPGMVWY